MKKIAVILSVLLIFMAVFTMPAYADSASIALSKSNITVGSNVTVTVTYNAGFGMFAIDATLSYNSAVLQYVSGGTNNGSAVKIVEALSGEKSTSAKVVFKAIAAGSGSLSFSAKASGEGDGSASAGASVNVTAVQPSSNANLSSLSLSSGALSPQFSANKTEYTAAVDYDVEKITITARAAAGDSVVTGAGTFELKIGDNKNSITVTAASGAKKTYNITVKRMTEEETAAAKAAARESDPYLIVVNETDYYIKPDLTELGSISGYTLSSVERKGANIAVFLDDNNKYSLYWATDENGENGAFFTANESGEFEKLNYIKLADKLYIIEEFESDISVNEQFVPAKYELNGVSVDCYKYSDSSMSDFYVFNCYANGKNDYYRYDAAENTIQREPMFLFVAPADVKSNSWAILDKFNNLTTQAKIVLGLLCLAGILVITLIVLLIVKAANKKPAEDEIENTAFSNVDFNSIILDDSLITEDVKSNNDAPVEEELPVVYDDDSDDSIDKSEFLDADD